MLRPRKETENLSLSITKNWDTLFDQNQAKPEELTILAHSAATVILFFHHVSILPLSPIGWFD